MSNMAEFFNSDGSIILAPGHPDIGPTGYRNFFPCPVCRHRGVVSKVFFSDWDIEHFRVKRCRVCEDVVNPHERVCFFIDDVIEQKNVCR